MTRRRGYISVSLRTERAFLLLVNALHITGAEAQNLHFPGFLTSRVLTEIPPVKGTYARFGKWKLAPRTASVTETRGLRGAPSAMESIKNIQKKKLGSNGFKINKFKRLKKSKTD